MDHGSDVCTGSDSGYGDDHDNGAEAHEGDITMPVDVYLLLPAAAPNMPPNLPPLVSDAPKDDPLNRQFPSSLVVPVRDFSFGAQNPTTIGSVAGGAGAGKVRFDELVVKKSVDQLSASLFVIAASGGHFPSAQLVVRKAGGTREAARPYLAYEFQMVFVTAVEWSGDGDEGPVEQVTFAYGGLAVGYYSQKPDGSLGKPTKQGWSEMLNKPTGPETLQGF
jgi:type VI secretion system secreted protein Hcp